MPSGAAVIRYEGARKGVVWRIKYRDATRRQVQETLGPASEGWTRRKAEAELRKRLVDVERIRLRRPDRISFSTFAEEWLKVYPDSKGLKRSTREGYSTIIRKHLIPSLGNLQIGALTVEHLESYLAEKRKSGLAPGTLNRHLNMLSLLFKAAIRRRLRTDNPVEWIDRPKEPRRRWAILTPDEVRRAEREFTVYADEADGEERAWREQARVIFLTDVIAGPRRGEILGFHWRDVDLVEPTGAVLRVRETWVRSARDTPKSEAGERTIPLGPWLSEELWQHRRRTAFAGDDERVFCSPTKGTPFDVGRYASTLKTLLRRAGISRPVRPFHDMRHTAITNEAASGNSPLAIMKHAGHNDFKTTQRYIDLAGITFREEAERAEQRFRGEPVPLDESPQTTPQP
jgi:integrase